jgi:hypothetical protein
VKHEKLFIGADDEGSDCGDGGKGLRNGVALEDLGDGKHVRRDMVGQGFLKLGKGVVAGEDGAGADATVAGGGDIVLHIADQKGLFRAEVVVLENAVDGIPLVGDTGIGLAEEVVHAEAAGLVLKIGLVNGAEEKGGQIAGVAVFENFPGPGQEGDGVVKFPEDLSEDLFQLVEGGVGDVLFVEALVREIEFFTEGLAVKRGFPVGGKDPVSSLEDGGEIVHESARPVEDQVADHCLG